MNTNDKLRELIRSPLSTSNPSAVGVTRADRDDTLTAAMDNVLSSRLGSALGQAAAAPFGDSIDRGLALRRILEDAGFGLVKLTDDHFFIGHRQASIALHEGGRGEQSAWGFRAKKTGDLSHDAVMEDLARRIDDE